MHSQQEQNFHSFINDIYGLTVVHLIRSLENEQKRLARFRNHRIFNLRCRDLRIIPGDLFYRCSINTSRAKRLTRNFGLSLLQERIGECCKIIGNAEKQIERLKSILRDVLNHDIYVDVIRLTEDSGERVFKIFKERQVKKLSTILMKVGRSTKYPFIRNCSSFALSEAEMCVLNRGPKFALSNENIPITEIVSGVEECLRHVPQSSGDVARAKISNLLNSAKPACSNLPTEELTAVRNLKKNDAITILPADKGGGLVCMDKVDYARKVVGILHDESTYEKAEWNPRNWIFDRTVDIVRDIKKAGGIDFQTVSNIYPNTRRLPSFYGLPKVHKPETPLRPIVTYCGTTTSGLASYIASILSSLVGHSGHHVRNTQDFKNFIDQVTLDEGEILVSFDVTALFTSVPVDEAVEVIRARLEADSTLGERCRLSVDNICRILRFLLNNTFFTYEGVCYRQTFGAAMGSPVSVVIANIFMENFEEKAIESFINPIRFWRRFVDDCCAALRKEHVFSFLDHLNGISPSIKFTLELEEDGKLPFLDLLLSRGDDGKIHTMVYRKPTALGQYLHFESNHPMSVKRGIIKSLFRRAESLSSCREAYLEEVEKITADLILNGYPLALIRRTELELHFREKDECTEWKGYAVIPYVKGISESIRRILGRLGIRVTFRPTKTIRQQICRPKDPVPKLERVNVVYRIPCRDCADVYIGETGRELGKRLAEHKAALTGDRPDHSAVAEHALSNAHQIAWEDCSVVDTDSNTYGRRMKEAIKAKVNAPIMNRDDLLSVHPAWLPLLNRL